VSAVSVAVVKVGSSDTSSPVAARTLVSPVLVARTRSRRVSTARHTASAWCCTGWALSPYQASFVRLTSSVAPFATAARAGPGMTSS